MPLSGSALLSTQEMSSAGSFRRSIVSRNTRRLRSEGTSRVAMTTRYRDWSKAASTTSLSEGGVSTTM